MVTKITKSTVSSVFRGFGALTLCVGGLCLLIAASAAAKGGLFLGFGIPTGLFGLALVVNGLLYVGLGEICDHISISANNSRVAAEQLMEVNSNLTELIRIQKRDS